MSRRRVTPRSSETNILQEHLNRLTKLIDSSKLVEYDQSNNNNHQPRITAKSTNTTGGFANRTSNSIRSQPKRPTTAASSRRLNHTATLSRPSTASSTKRRSSPWKQLNRKQSIRPATSTQNNNMRIYGTTSLRPSTERPSKTPVGSNLLDHKAKSPLHYSFLIKKQDSMLKMSQHLHSQLSPGGNEELHSASTDLMQLRTMVEKSKRVLLDRIDALLNNDKPQHSQQRLPYRVKM
jgi:hypothetical protein